MQDKQTSKCELITAEGEFFDLYAHEHNVLTYAFLEVPENQYTLITANNRKHNP